MSVLKNDRGISEMEVYNTAIKLRVEITKQLVRNFGIKTEKGKYLGQFTEQELEVNAGKNPRIAKCILNIA